MRVMEDPVLVITRTQSNNIERLAKCLRWYVETDETNPDDPENEFWTKGHDEAETLLKELGYL